MKLCEELKQVLEGQHYNTKVRGVDENMGSRRIRMGIKESMKAIGNMKNENHPSPNPLTNKDLKLLDECVSLMEQCIPRLRDVKETRKRK